MAASPQQIIAGLYTAFFNRAPDQTGLNYWDERAANGSAFETYNEIASGFAGHYKFGDIYDGMTDQQFVEAIYVNTLGSAGDSAGILFWTDNLGNGLSRSEMVASFVYEALNFDANDAKWDSLSAEDKSGADSRKDSITNKSDAGIYFVERFGAASNIVNADDLDNDEAYLASISILSNIDSSLSSVELAKEITGQTLFGSDFVESDTVDGSDQAGFDVHEIVSTTGVRHWIFNENGVELEEDTTYSTAYSEAGTTTRWDWDGGYDLDVYDEFGIMISSTEFDSAGNVIIDDDDDDGDGLYNGDISSSGTESSTYSDEFGNVHVDVISIDEVYHYDAAGKFTGLTRTETVIESPHLSGTEVLEYVEYDAAPVELDEYELHSNSLVSITGSGTVIGSDQQKFFEEYSVIFESGLITESWAWEDSSGDSGSGVEVRDEYGNDISYIEYDAAGNVIIDAVDEDNETDISSSGVEYRLYRDASGNEHTDVITIDELYSYDDAGQYTGKTITETVVDSSHLSGSQVLVIGPDWQFISVEGSLWN